MPTEQQPPSGEGMEAGPELDAAVARAVFGLNVLHAASGMILAMCNHPNTSPEHHSLAVHPIRPYSTDIAAAWTVVERMREIELKFVIGDEPDGWEVEVVVAEALYARGYRGNYTTRISIAEAICIAALRALAAAADARPRDGE